MVAAKLDTILPFLKKEGYEAEKQKGTDQLFFLIKKPPREFPVFLRVMPGEELLQILAFIPCQLKEEPRGETARLLHLLNKELDLPGFGMDEENNVAFYRVMVLINQGDIPEGNLRQYLSVCERVCEGFSGAIEVVASGQMDLKELMAKADDLRQPE